MFKLLFIFFLFVSSPLYSDKLNYLYQKNEFTYHCDNKNNTFSMIFKIETRDKTIVHSQTVSKSDGSVMETNKYLDIFYWDEDNESVWTTDYFHYYPMIRIMLFNFKKQKLVRQFLKNEVSKDRKLFTDKGDVLNCYTLE